ncbi:SMa0974 family conjugal transfer regulator [Ensifer adhaerens]|uniref:SMa0974 family conjugal transfer regulator n=1 Tax=Ensifer adhaerens TaxID=106592 RepID=UPI003F85A5A0
MYKHTAEAFVAVQNAEQGVSEVFARYREYWSPIGATGVDRSLDFGDARVTLRPTDEGLHFRIDAQDTLAFYGIWTLLQVTLAALPEFTGKDVGWHPTDRFPCLSKVFFRRILSPD